MKVIQTLPIWLMACTEYNLDGADKPVLGADEEETAIDESRPPIAIAGPSLRIIKGESVTLTGLESYDPDDSSPTLSYRWVMSEAVEGATVTFEETETGQPTFSADVVGTYIATLEVTDDDQLISENYAATLIEVRPYENLTIEATWDISGVDVDLHLISPDGTYYGPGDCFFGNPSPDWGEVGNSFDDPTLLSDDEGSEQREQVDLQYPQEGMYSVYVTYYNQRDSEYPYVTPSISVIGSGQVLYEGEGPRLINEGAVWRAGFLYWENLHFEPDATLLDHVDLGGPSYND